MSSERNRGGRPGGHQGNQRDWQPKARRANSPLDLAGYPCYFKGDKLDPVYLDQYARKIATDFGNSSPRLTKSQMRGFFGDVKRVETRFRATEDLDMAKERLLQLKAMAHERWRKNKVPSEFRRFIEKNVDSVVDGMAFGAFVKHFEAVVAYSEGKLEQR